MRIVHRIGLRATPAQRRHLESLGLKLPNGSLLPGGGDMLLAFDLDEDHPNWHALSTTLREWNASDVLRTEFSKKEIIAASWLNLVSDWHHGYPQPEEDVFGYRQATYDLSNWCQECGIGMKQNAPFQMKGEPSWGKNGILQLDWVYDEYFVTPEVWTRVFQPFGIEALPVKDPLGVELKTVRQLAIDEEVDIETEGLQAERCPKCGRLRYQPITRGAFPMLAHAPSNPIARTRQYFGSGHLAYKGVLIAQELARDMAAAKVRGASVKPVQG